MRTKATNLSLLCLICLQVCTGIGAFLAGAPSWAPVVWLHATGGFALVILFYWKRPIVGRSLGRRALGLWALPGLALLTLTVGALATGIGWSTVGLPSFGPYSALTVHVALGVSLLVFLLAHGRQHWTRVRARDIGGRRAIVRSGLLLAAGAAVWQTTELTSRLLDLSGKTRRFTGSRLTTSFSGNDFPSSNWLTDHPDPLDQDAWRLRVTGHVERDLTMRLSELSPASQARAVLDCTGGWYSEQDWTGTPLRALLDTAVMRAGAGSVVVRSSTGYWRRYTLAEARGALLATHVGSSLLAHEHGAPLRLVMPGKRGYEWVKWITTVEVSTASPLLKWPLPIS